ncbi:hypothetical protein D3C76_1242010 [compost metagenome]
MIKRADLNIQLFGHCLGQGVYRASRKVLFEPYFHYQVVIGTPCITWITSQEGDEVPLSFEQRLQGLCALFTLRILPIQVLQPVEQYGGLKFREAKILPLNRSSLYQFQTSHSRRPRKQPAVSPQLLKLLRQYGIRCHNGSPLS